MEEIQQNKDDLTVSLKIINPINSRESQINTLVLLLRELYNVETDKGQWDYEMKTKVTNNLINTMILELNTLKIKEE